MSAEQIIAFINVTQPPNHFVLCFASKKLLVAKTESVETNHHWTMIFGMLGAFLRLFVDVSKNQRRGARRKAREISTLPANDILGLDESNFSIEYEDIIILEVKRFADISGHVSLTTTDGNQEFAYTFDSSQDKGDFEEQLETARSILGEKLITS